jgi:ankyrin repeat protein
MRVPVPSKSFCFAEQIKRSGIYKERILLHLAAWEGDLLAINVLSDARTINEFASKGVTALVLAILNEHVDRARRLLAFGADINIELVGGKRPVDYICSSENTEIRALIDRIPD